jgi:L-asparaginase
MSASFSKNVVVLGTGGTIAGLLPHPDTTTGYDAAQVSVSAIADQAGLAGVLTPLAWGLQSHQVAQVDSKDMERSIWHALCSSCLTHLNDPNVTALVIAHGTDTMAETAYLLQRLFEHAKKPVVITGAMRAHNDPQADGPKNLKDAVDFAARLSQAGLFGVSLVFDGIVHEPLRVKKVSSLSSNAFHSYESDWLKERIDPARLISEHQPLVQFEPMQDPMQWKNWTFDPQIDPQSWPHIELLTCHADMASCLYLDYLIDLKINKNQGDKRDSLSGLVISGLGSGTWPRVLEPKLRHLLDLGVWLVLCSQVPWGHAQAAKGALIAHEHFVFSTLDPAKARIALMMHLMA